MVTEKIAVADQTARTGQATLTDEADEAEEALDAQGDVAEQTVDDEQTTLHDLQALQETMADVRIQDKEDEPPPNPGAVEETPGLVVKLWSLVESRSELFRQGYRLDTLRGWLLDLKRRCGRCRAS